MRKKVNIRTDGNSAIGHGHIVRCQALSQMLSEEFDCRFFCKDIPQDIAARLVSEGVEVELIETENDFFGKLIQGDLVVLDGYHFDNTYRQQIRKKGAVLFLIDDLISGDYAADVIINHSPGNTPSDYHALSETRFALGTDYALLRMDYQLAARKTFEPEDDNSIFVCFGGSDVKQLTLTVLRELKATREFNDIIVVTGSGFQAVDALLELIEDFPEVHYYRSLSESTMIRLLQHCKYAIVPCSGVLFETIAMKRHIISGRYVDNQERLYTQFKALNAFTDAGTFQPEEIRNALKAVRQNTQEPKTLIDGFAPLRFQNLFSVFSENDSFALRRALPEDLGATYIWANDPSIRTHFFSREPISLEEHGQWFQRKIADPECFYYIATEKPADGQTSGKPMGSIRFDIHGTEAVISYLLDPAFQGNGYGTILLRMGIDRLLENRIFRGKKITEITGFVLPANIPSLRSFEKLNFERLIPDTALNSGEQSVKFSHRITYENDY